MASLGKLILCIFTVSARIALISGKPGKQILCIFIVSAHIGLVVGKLGEADVMHICGKCAHRASYWQAQGSIFNAYLWYVRALG